MDSPQWYEDPVFDEFEEVYAGETFRGDDWRRLTALKEMGLEEVVHAAGTTFRTESLKEAVESKSMSASLEAEPSNKYDKLAVKLLVGGRHIGYVPRSKRIRRDASIGICKMGMLPKPHCVLLTRKKDILYQ